MRAITVILVKLFLFLILLNPAIEYEKFKLQTLRELSLIFQVPLVSLLNGNVKNINLPLYLDNQVCQARITTSWSYIHTDFIFRKEINWGLYFASKNIFLKGKLSQR